MMNGFLPTSLPVSAQQWWRTRGQGDSLSVAQQLADIVGIDFYPRHALFRVGATTFYLDGSRSPWQQRRRKQLFACARAQGRRLMVTEGQAEPWEAVTNPPNPYAQGMYSCLPEQVIENYNQCMSWARPSTGRPHPEDIPRPLFDPAIGLYAYLFWGAEYWVLRQKCGDPRYIRAFARILEHA
jgi:hypothetical protein